MSGTQFKILVRDTRMDKKERIRIRLNMTLEQVVQAIEETLKRKKESQETASQSI